MSSSSSHLLRMEAALGPAGAGPATLTARAGNRRVAVADRVVTAVVQRVVGQIALLDVRPAVVVAPVGQRVRLPELVRLVPAELRRGCARRRLVAADAGDPGIEIEKRAVQRLELRDREVQVGLGLPEPVLDRTTLEPLDRGVVSPLD